MDINSTTSTTTVNTTSTSNTAVATKTPDDSFKKEMNEVETKEQISQDKVSSEESAKTNSDDNETLIKENNENKEDISAKVDDKNSNTDKILSSNEIFDNDKTFNVNIALSDNNDLEAVLLSGKVDINNMQTLFNANKELQAITQEVSIATKIDYSVIQMDMDDAQFFQDLVKDTDATLQNVVSTLQQNVDVDVKNVEKQVKISATLMDALSNAQKTNQPFRIDFDKDVSIIIRIDRDGALSARFIPGDKAVEEYLRQNISTLRQRFDEEELPYNNLSYSRQQQNRKHNNKERDNE